MNLRTTPKTYDVIGETDPWWCLADAIVIQAVRDFRNSGTMIHLLKRRIQEDDRVTNEGRNFLMWRIKNYKTKLNQLRQFFRSDFFADICNLNGVALLRKLEREIA